VNLRGESLGPRHKNVGSRCAVVSDGFYEWPGKGLAPFWFHRADDGLVLLGGLFQRPKGEDVHARFTVLTTRPNALVANVHDRMPIVLPVDRLDEWLTADPAAALRLVGPAPEDALVATPVSKHVNSVRHDDPECVAPADHRAPPAQGSLF
jgi:putative SOS response-associated peptidase YedK